MDILESTTRARQGKPQSGIALGRVTRVYPKERFCEVKTFFGEPGFNDMFISRCQWLSTDANPEGDESTTIPRAGSTGMVFFVNGQPFIWGYFRTTTNKTGAANLKAKTTLNEGDKIIATVGGNHVVVKSNGIVEIRSSDTLRTVYFPKEGLLGQLCEAYELNADWGYIKGKVIDKITNETLHTTEYRRDMTRTSIVYEERGRVTGTIVKRTSIGPGIPGQTGVTVPVFTQSIDLTGEMVGEIGLAGTGPSWKISPTGDAEFKNIFSSISLSATGDWTIKTPIVEAKLSATGDISVKNKVATAAISTAGDLSFTNGVIDAKLPISGDISIKNPIASLEMKKDGDLTLENAVGTFKMDKTGKFILKGAAAELLDLFIQTLDAFINQTQLTMTGVGPSSGLLPPAMTNLIKIKALMGAIKGPS